jgi:hypothetical protein
MSVVVKLSVWSLELCELIGVHPLYVALQQSIFEKIIPVSSISKVFTKIFGPMMDLEDISY